MIWKLKLRINLCIAAERLLELDTCKKHISLQKVRHQTWLTSLTHDKTYKQKNYSKFAPSGKWIRVPFAPTNQKSNMEPEMPDKRQLIDVQIIKWIKWVVLVWQIQSAQQFIADSSTRMLGRKFHALREFSDQLHAWTASTGFAGAKVDVSNWITSPIQLSSPKLWCFFLGNPSISRVSTRSQPFPALLW